jgi:hypothetical protein
MGLLTTFAFSFCIPRIERVRHELDFHSNNQKREG